MARILVVDDDDDVRTAIRRILEPSGHRVLEAASGQGGMTRMDTESADLVLTDLYMEPMDGVEFVIRLRQLAPEVPIIAISGGGWRSADDVLARARSLGVRATVRKPFTNKGLRNLVEKVLAEKEDEAGEEAAEEAEEPGERDG